jgi:hypothetical protein
VPQILLLKWDVLNHNGGGIRGYITPVVCHLYRRLAEAAAAGDVSAVEVVLQDLEAAGMQPGPRAFHVLVFTHTKLEQHEEAWHAATRAIAAGAVLLEETYILLILGHMKVPSLVDFLCRFSRTHSH